MPHLIFLAPFLGLKIEDVAQEFHHSKKFCSKGPIQASLSLTSLFNQLLVFVGLSKKIN